MKNLKAENEKRGRKFLQMNFLFSLHPSLRSKTKSNAWEKKRLLWMRRIKINLATLKWKIQLTLSMVVEK